jgi:UDP-N-acetylmuramyl pentapeptide synthase
MLQHLLQSAGVVLIKASRSVGLEDFATTLKDPAAAR